MIEFIIKYWLEVGFGLLCAAVGAGFKLVSKKLKERQEEEEARRAQRRKEEEARWAEQESLKEGVLSLLHDRLYQGCRYHIHNDEITDEEMKNMEYLYKGYHALGGNGTGTELYERIKKLPLKEN